MHQGVLWGALFVFTDRQDTVHQSSPKYHKTAKLIIHDPKRIPEKASPDRFVLSTSKYAISQKTITEGIAIPKMA
ncbi:hypothetical protein AN191_04235 [Loktanella sp. 5RATIMAR09]|nr:hypothetical protein AN191_04235 [Loktanella sp. 5RATIMAR09]